MKNSYFLLFGFTEPSIDILAKKIGDELGTELEARTSDYKGDYYKYEGFYADKLVVESNFIEYLDDFKEPEFKSYITLINISILEGREKDKRAKLNSLKRFITKTFSNAILLRESVLPHELPPTDQHSHKLPPQQ